MSKYLVIVESPAKSKTIEKYLGNEYTVVASMGHIRNLANKGHSDWLRSFTYNIFRQINQLPHGLLKHGRD